MDVITEVKLRISAIEEKSQKRRTRYGDFPTKGGDGGDDCLWLGLLSTVNVSNSLDGLLSCQSKHEHSKHGMFYRNPERRNNDNIGYGSNFFSRDMALGVLLGLASSNKKITMAYGEPWVNEYIMKNRPCSVKKPKWMGGGCLVRHPFYTLAPGDDRVNITPALWALIGRVWDYHGLKRNTQMQKYKGADGDIPVIEAQQAPLGYQLHLKAVSSYLKMIVGQSREYRIRIAKICYERLPENLFYKILSQEKAYKEDLEYFLEICPNPDEFIPKDYWIWEKGDFADAVKNKKCCGWDMVFIGRLLISLY